MYLIKIDEEQMNQLHQIREARKAGGEKKTTIIGLVREAVGCLISEEPQDEFNNRE